MGFVTGKAQEDSFRVETIEYYKIITPTIKNTSKGYLTAKRSFDIIMSLILGGILFVPMLLIAVAVRIDSSGPALFCQERLGKDGKPFVMLKFRSMYIDAESNGPQWAKVDDQRCTKVGRILRNSRLDELPQLWNIFKGDMSFVGPRPERAYFYKEFEKDIPNFHDRLQTKPGLTGWAQVNGGYDLKPEEKIIFDLDYIKKCSVKVDIICILRTVSLIFTHKGAR